MLEIIPKHLRELFVTSWNSKYPNCLWKDNAACSQQLYNDLWQSARERQTKLHKTCKKMLLGVSVDLWDPSVLFFVLLQEDLNLLQFCRAACEISPSFIVSENVECLRASRDSFLDHVTETSLTLCEFEAISSRMKIALSVVFGMHAVKETEEILSTQVTTGLAIHLKSQLQQEIEINSEYKEFIKWKEDTTCKIKSK